MCRHSARFVLRLWCSMCAQAVNADCRHLGRLTELQIFNASHNKLVTLPASFGQLYKLNDLILDHNRLLFLPDNITALKELRTFEVDQNYIGEVPEYGKMTTVAGTLAQTFAPSMPRKRKQCF